MTSAQAGAGRPVWLELNAQRVIECARFYQELFAWGQRALHVRPFGALPLLANAERVFANQFMAMGAFAPPMWLCRFAAPDLPRALAAIRRGGGLAPDGIAQIGGLGDWIGARDPAGHGFSLIDLAQPPPEPDAPGDPCTAELWGPKVSRQADFYADVLGLHARATAHGASLDDATGPRLHLRDTDFDIQPPRWIPYFRSLSVGADVERAVRAGAIVQVGRDTAPGIGDLAVLTDPGGCCFGIVDPDVPGTGGGT